MNYGMDDMNALHLHILGRAGQPADIGAAACCSWRPCSEKARASAHTAQASAARQASTPMLPMMLVRCTTLPRVPVLYLLLRHTIGVEEFAPAESPRLHRRVRHQSKDCMQY